MYKATRHTGTTWNYRGKAAVYKDPKREAQVLATQWHGSRERAMRELKDSRRQMLWLGLLEPWEYPLNTAALVNLGDLAFARFYVSRFRAGLARFQAVDVAGFTPASLPLYLLLAPKYGSYMTRLAMRDATDVPPELQMIYSYAQAKRDQRLRLSAGRRQERQNILSATKSEGPREDALSRRVFRLPAKDRNPK